MKRNIILVFVLAIVVLIIWVSYPYLKNKSSSATKLSGPLDATYTIEGTPTKLVNGMAEVEIAPGSASKLVTKVFGQPSYGDLNTDGVDDAVTLVTQTSSGSGTFYYALVALGKDGGYEGLSGVLLGDRIAPQSVLIKDDVAMVNYADRNPGEPMTTQPSLGITKYLVVEDGSVKEFNLRSNGEQVFVGNLIMAHEARTFTPCGGTAHWVVGASSAYPTLMSAYTANKPTTSPYASVYAVISGVVVSKPTDGFGMDYDYGIDVRNLLKVIPTGVCPKV